MQSHPSYAALAPIATKYPRAAGALFQTYNDILHAQEWTEVEVIELQSVKRAAIAGKKPKTDEKLYVLPCALAETLSFGWFQEAFAELSDPPEIIVAITSDDASIVYYKLSRGLVKPQL
ncbi:Sen15 domain-containing protein [Mycena kentingensis (nom. inval.)]|nr:Sen15 domain-containing protein [Mycena kentingensis (nom. inval.)]